MHLILVTVFFLVDLIDKSFNDPVTLIESNQLATSYSILQFTVKEIKSVSVGLVIVTFVTIIVRQLLSNGVKRKVLILTSSTFFFSIARQRINKYILQEFTVIM